MLSLLLTSQVWALGSGTGAGTGTTPATEEPADSGASTGSVPATTGSANPEAVETKPVENQTAPKVSTKGLDGKKYCNDLEDLKERIKCRLQKNEAELKEELAAIYMPEECRAMEAGVGQGDCVSRYKSLKPCWTEDPGAERIACVKEKLGIDKLMKAADYCKDKADVCQAEYKEKVYHLITFRFYDAEERVEEWYEEGKLSLEDTVDFIAVVVESKVNFNKAKTKAERVAVIKNIQSEWEKVVAKVKKS